MDSKIETSDFLGLITELCESLMEKCHLEYSTRSDNTRIINQMRKTAFEILLNKHHESYNINDNQQIEASDPIRKLLKHCFVLKTTVKLFSSAIKLENILDHLMDDEKNDDSSLKSVLNFLYYLRNYESLNNDNLGFFDTKTMRISSSSRQWNKEVPQYEIFPLSSLELPIKINKLTHTSSYKFNIANIKVPIIKIFELPQIMNKDMSITPPLMAFNVWNDSFHEAYDMICDKSTTELPENLREVEFQNAHTDECASSSIESINYEESSKIENYTWETLGNAKISKHTSFILDCASAFKYFENIRDIPFHSDKVYECSDEKCNIITMEKFIENSKLVLLGIDSNCYAWNKVLGFVLDVNISVSGLSRESLHSICSDITHWATCHKLLSLLVHTNPESGELRKDGLIFKAMCNNIEDILIYYHAAILQVFNHYNSSGLLNLLDRLRDVGLLISEVARLCRFDEKHQTTLGEGTRILSHIYNEITRITKPKIALVYYSVLKSCCEVYFQQLEKWIFDGICDEAYDEFMVKVRSQYLRDRGHKFWRRCFEINKEAVPGFLKNLTDSILQCGKAVRLLKICDPKNSIFNFFATKRPTVKVCLNMDMLVEQEKISSEYMANGIEILGSNVTVSSAFRKIKSIEKEKADYVIAAQHDTLQRIKQIHENARLQLIQSKRELLEDQKKQCEDAALRREKAREITLMEDKLLMEQQAIENEQIRRKKLADAKVTLDYYKDLAKEANKRRLRATWRAQRMALYDERTNKIFMEYSDEVNSIDDKKSHEHQSEHVSTNLNAQENNITITNLNSMQEILIDDSMNNDENCNRSNSKTSQQEIIKTDEITRAKRPTMLDFIRKDIHIFEDEVVNNRSIDTIPLQTEDILDEIARSNHLFQKSCTTQVFHSAPGQCNETNNTCDTNFTRISNVNNAMLSNDNNCNIIIVDEVNNENMIIDNLNQRKNLNDTPIESVRSQCTQPISCEINDATPMSCTTDSYVPSAIGSSVLYNYNEIGSFSDSKNDFETLTTPGDCPTTNTNKHEFSIENIFTRFNAQYFNLFHLTDSNHVISESSLTKSDTEIIDNTSLQVYLEKSVFIPLRVQNYLANAAIVKCLLHDHKILLHFQSLRSFFFLLNGEFAKNLTGPLYTKFYEISLPVELFNSHTLTNLLKNALHCSMNNSYVNSELLSLTAFESPSVLQILDPQALNCLCLHYKVSWPLNIIIDEALMQQYSKVFKFLLMVGRVSWVLQDDFCILKNKRKAALSHQYHRVQLFRHAMMQFMTALHNYITCSVLHASWTEFEKELENAVTLDQIYTTHVSYIKKILSRCMLTNRGEKLRICLRNTFEIILKFHNCLRSYEWTVTSIGYIHPNYKKLEQLYDAFCILRTYPAQVVDRSASSGYQMHLSHFVDALNINPLFSL